MAQPKSEIRISLLYQDSLRHFFSYVIAFLLSSNLFGQSDTIATSTGSKWGIGLEFGPCTGWFFATGEASQKINDGWCYANVGATFSWKRIHYTFHIGGLSGSLDEDLDYGTDWKKTNRFGSSHLQLSAAYEWVNTKHFNVMPFLNAGLVAFNSGPDSIAANPTATGWLPTASLGTIFDLKLNLPVLPKNRSEDYEYGNQYYYLRIITGVYPAYFRNPFRLNGSMYFISLNLGFYLRAA
jgi:hypothetical protein